EVMPAVGVEDGTVHRVVQFTEFEDVGRVLVGTVESVVGLGESFVVADHDIGSEFVVGFAGDFSGGGVFIVLSGGRQARWKATLNSSKESSVAVDGMGYSRIFGTGVTGSRLTSG